MSMPAAASTRTVGPYRLIGQIGQGGMGLVFLAQGPDDRRVAVKVLRPSVVGDAEGRARLAREVASLRRVRSPRIAEVYDADPWGETPYVVMRYVAGPSLREVVDHRGPLSGAQLISFARGLAEALVVVHQAAVLHRDVKPSNVLIENGEPVLIDFGVAQHSDDMTLTQVGWLLGTPGYLAPEILNGDDPTPAADIHAWAATVCFAATGHGPYGTGPAVAVLDRARRGESSLDDLPEELADVVAAALRPDPANRPTARQLVDWLEARQARTPPPRGSEMVMPRAVPAGATASGAPRDLQDHTSALPISNGAPQRRSWRAATFWTLVLLLVVATTVMAPLVGLLGVVLGGWALRGAQSATTAVSSWQVARGPRRMDLPLGLLLTPWWALRTVAASAVNAVVLLLVCGGFVALARWGPDGAATPALVAAGLLAAGVGWHGPFTRDVRRGGLLLSARLPASELAMATLVLLLLAVVSGLLAAQQIVGTSYSFLGG